MKNILPYNTAQRLGKAVRAANKSLPLDKNKKVAVLRKILEKIEPNLKMQNISKFTSPSIDNKRKLSQETIEKIRNFYLREDISRVSPRMKDRVKIKRGDHVEYVPKRYMYLTIKEAFQIFTEENPNTKIKLS